MLAGEIGRPHGTAGEVYVVPISDDPHRWDGGARLTRADGSEIVVERSRRHRGNRLLVKFAEIDSRAAADRLRGPVYVGSDRLRALEEGQYWQHDLIGCRVSTVQGADVGAVSEIVTGPAQDLMSVAAAGRTILVPLVEPIIVEVDVAAERVVIDPPEGLLD